MIPGEKNSIWNSSKWEIISLQTIQKIPAKGRNQLREKNLNKIKNIDKIQQNRNSIYSRWICVHVQYGKICKAAWITWKSPNLYQKGPQVASYCWKTFLKALKVVPLGGWVFQQCGQSNKHRALSLARWICEIMYSHHLPWKVELGNFSIFPPPVFPSGVNVILTLL